MFQAVIFDMDGVLADSEPLHFRAEKITLAPLGVRLRLKDVQPYMGTTPRVFLEGMIRQHGLDVSLESLLETHHATLLDLYRSEARPIPGALRLVHRLRELGVDLALASSSHQCLVDAVLERFELRDFFRVVVSGDQVSRAKPWPDIFLEAVKRLGSSVSSCIVIEDSEAGVRAAKAAGIRCIGFRSPHSRGQNLDTADCTVDRLSPNLVKTMAGLFEKPAIGRKQTIEDSHKTSKSYRRSRP